MKRDNLGNRIKGYEEVAKYKLLRRTPVLIRVDGRAFHTFTKNAKKPFDKNVIDAMIYATEMTAKEMSGFELAYVQSDEATFLLQDYATLSTQPWFDYEVNKLVSITASAFTAYFNSYWFNYFSSTDGETKFAMFDARAFNMPYDDTPNAFIWRQQDWIRNSVQMKARAHFTHKHLENVSVEEIKQELYNIGVPWESLTDTEKYGTFITKDGKLSARFSYEQIKMMMTRPGDE